MAILIFANRPESHSGRKDVFLAVAQAGHRSALCTTAVKVSCPPYTASLALHVLRSYFTDEETKSQHGPSPALGTASQEFASGCAVAHYRGLQKSGQMCFYF